MEGVQKERSFVQKKSSLWKRVGAGEVLLKKEHLGGRGDGQFVIKLKTHAQERERGLKKIKVGRKSQQPARARVRARKVPGQDKELCGIESLQGQNNQKRAGSPKIGPCLRGGGKIPKKKGGEGLNIHSGDLLKKNLTNMVGMKRGGGGGGRL